MDDLDGKGIFAPVKRRKYRRPATASRMVWGAGMARQRKAEAAERFEKFAEAMANNTHLDGDKSILAAGRAVGIAPTTAKHYFTRLRKRMGWQAQ